MEQNPIRIVAELAPRSIFAMACFAIPAVIGRGHDLKMQGARLALDSSIRRFDSGRILQFHLFRDATRFAELAGAPGFEPGMAGPKPAALPLGYAPTGPINLGG